MLFLTETRKEKRDDAQQLIRITKNLNGSSFSKMKYEEIQNDYQAYWSIINDENQHPALIANCMRNIIEYFFNFVQKADLSNVIQKPELQGNRFQSFCRYINRESHSLGQNIFDLKEFDYSVFREGLRLTFELTGYPEHYKKMAKL
ncbi:AAA family ATPase [Stutzerimonas nitrititolerans]|uniref:AAA family ATPase n=1 Tax=Stutzerimonas nitrititolerans TaxID=2482751 RepID=UPI0035E3CE0A